MTALPGHGQQTGPQRPDWGPGWSNLTCTACNATWIGPDGETCRWCLRQIEIMREADKKRRRHT